MAGVGVEIGVGAEDGDASRRVDLVLKLATSGMLMSGVRLDCSSPFQDFVCNSQLDFSLI